MVAKTGLRLADFDYELPEELIAQVPASPREAARLLDLRTGLPEDRIVGDLPDLLPEGSVLVVNDTRVLPAQLTAERSTGGKVHLNLHQRSPVNDGDDGIAWRAFARPGKRLKAGEVLRVGQTHALPILDILGDGEILIALPSDEPAASALLKDHGRMPLPPYIKRASNEAPPVDDTAAYQTMFATRDGAVAAPTAGLHFTPALWEKLTARGITHETVTLHVGAGTFLPVKHDDPTQHVMHKEWGQLTADTAARLNRARLDGRTIICVGTTVMRILESAADEGGQLHAFADETGIYILPGYRFRFVDHLMTNFHLPKSTLFMLVSAFSGLNRMQAAYAHAVAERYRFFSYGDACLLKRMGDLTG